MAKRSAHSSMYSIQVALNTLYDLDNEATRKPHTFFFELTINMAPHLLSLPLHFDADDQLHLQGWRLMRDNKIVLSEEKKWNVLIPNGYRGIIFSHQGVIGLVINNGYSHIQLCFGDRSYIQSIRTKQGFQKK